MKPFLFTDVCMLCHSRRVGQAFRYAIFRFFGWRLVNVNFNFLLLLKL